MSRLAVVQKPPLLLDRDGTVRAAVALIREAAAAGAALVVFPETFIPGYPAWIWRLRPGGDYALSTELHARLQDHAVDLGADDLGPMCAAARECRVTVICGIDECESGRRQGTLYNSVVTIGPDGTIVNRHRKLMPTNPERMVWGFGDASGLKVVETGCGRVGTLICWENYMPLARYALYAQGVELYVAPTYDSGDEWIATLQHIAREGGCWVVGAGTVLRTQDIPDSLPGKAELYTDPEEWVNAGDSVVIAPGGEIVAGPMRQAQGILYADIDLSRVGKARRTLDVAGHYARPDIFRLQVNTKAAVPATFEEESR